MSYATLEWMRHNGVPITRENYIALNWMEVPGEWTPEHEGQLPEFLRQQGELGQDAYDPQEPRVQAGEGGGEWTKGGASAATPKSAPPPTIRGYGNAPVPHRPGKGEEIAALAAEFAKSSADPATRRRRPNERDGHG